jgi:hypothetical protein
MSAKFKIEEHMHGFEIVKCTGNNAWAPQVFLSKSVGFTRADAEALITSRMATEPKPRYGVVELSVPLPEPEGGYRYAVIDRTSIGVPILSIRCLYWDTAEALADLLNADIEAAKAKK